MSDEELSEYATRFTFGDVNAEKRSDDRWAVTRNGLCYCALEGFIYEPSPSNRDADFLATTRFSRSQAVELAMFLGSKR